MTSLFQLLKMKKIRPQIAKRIGLDEVGLSHRKLQHGQVRGTVICLPWKKVPRQAIHRLDAEDTNAVDQYESKGETTSDAVSTSSMKK